VTLVDDEAAGFTPVGELLAFVSGFLEGATTAFFAAGAAFGTTFPALTAGFPVTLEAGFATALADLIGGALLAAFLAEVLARWAVVLVTGVSSRRQLYLLLEA